MDDRRARAEAIEDFAAALRELRNAFGNPPFREMSGRSGAISHTTLHEATKGNRLPSWETTVEFVKACNADPAAYRERWEEANRVVRSAGAGNPAIRVGASTDQPADEIAVAATNAAEARTVHLTNGSPPPSQALPPPPGAPAGDAHPLPPPGASAGDTHPLAPPGASAGDAHLLAPPGAPAGHAQQPPPAQGRGSRLTRPAAFAAAAVTVGAAVLAVAAFNRGSEPGPDTPHPTGGPSVAAALSPADCPVGVTNPPWAPPLYEGDAAVFIEDVTLTDCTRVGTGETVTKVWRVKNAGEVPWKGYSLRRLDLTQQADQCQTISDVPIKDTKPGDTVDIQTVVTTPRKPGLCYVRFKMVDASGTVVFPGSRPLNFQLIVGGR